MNKFSITLTFAVLLAFSSVNALNTKQTLDFVAGLMDGVIEKDNLKELELCYTDVEKVTNELEEIAHEFEKMSIFGMLEAMKELTTLA